MTTPDMNQIEEATLREAQKQLDRAQAQVAGKPDTAFFMSLILSFRHKWDRDIPHTKTNGAVCRYNPVWFMTCDKDTREFVVVRNALHPALMHPLRRGGKFKDEWAIACDHEANLILRKRGFKIPEWAFCDSKYEGMNAETIYGDLLMNKDPKAKDPRKLPFLALDDAPDGMGPQLEHDLHEIIIRANIHSRQAGDRPGTIPSDIEVLLEELLDPKLPWERVCAKYIHESTGKSQYTYRKPNRRYLAAGFYMPSLAGVQMQNFTAYVDISSSVSDEDFKQQISEIASIMRMMRPKKIVLVTFNTGITGVHEVHSIPELQNVVFRGRGGTKIDDVIEHMNTTKPSLAMVFSDGEFNWPDTIAKNPVIWVVYDNPDFTAPFGQVTHYDIHHKRAQ